MAEIGWKKDLTSLQDPSNEDKNSPCGTKPKKRTSSTSSSSSSSSNSSKSSSEKKSEKIKHKKKNKRSDEYKREKRERRERKKLEKAKRKELKREQKKKHKEEKRLRKLSKNRQTEPGGSDYFIPIDLMSSKAKAPETKEEYEARQSKIRREIDPVTGRTRLVKGDGEILEEIVSKDRHDQINKLATKGDGDFFQSKTVGWNIP